jgi:type 1 fimbriae regulatory protein FimB/type 1 fimbriae regulatory protein FimE
MNPPPKVPNANRRSREHLTPAEIDRLIAAAQHLGRHGQRDATMILLAYRHGLRVSELVGLRECSKTGGKAGWEEVAEC